MTKHIKKVAGISRREVLVGSAAGAGLVIGYSVLPNAVDSASKAIAAGNWDHQQYLTMDTDGKAHVYITKCEIGQHVGTALAQAVAEELEINWDDVNVIYPDSHAKWGLMITGGSWSVNWTFDRNSRIGASARIALVEAGAKMMNASVNDCYAKNSTVYSNDGGSVTYKDILSKNTIDRTFSEEEMKAIKLKSFGEYDVVGKSKVPFDLPSKLDGSAKYGIDVFVPNMVYGIPLINPTRYGAIPKNVDESEAKKIDGYVGAYVNKEGFTRVNTGYVVALGETYWAAEKAAKALKVEWDLGPNKNISSKDIRDESIKLQKDPSSGFLWVLEGDTDKAMKTVSNKHTAVYETSIAYHGTLEPMNCTAYEKDGIMHLHGGHQSFTFAVGNTAAALGIEADKIVCHQYYAGGGFGRRTEPDNHVLAAQTTKFIGRPVKLMYSREQDMMFDFHRTPTYQVIEGGEEFGKLTAMKHDVVAGWSTRRAAPGFMPDSVDKKGKVDQFSTNGSDHWYDMPNHQVRSIPNDLSDKALPVGFLRAVAPAWTFWAVESYMDEMAKKAGRDPLAFRLDHLTAQGKNAGTPPNTVGGAHRLRNALLVAAGRAGYGVKPLGKNVGMGMAAVSSQERGSPTWTACVAEVEVNPESGDVIVKKVTISMDVGTAVNPEGVKKQIEGSALYGISLAMYEELTMKNGSIEQANFDTWTPMRLDQTPEIETVLIQNGHYPAGTGEPATTVVAPAIANAIDNAVGARVRSLPITPEKIKSAMREA
jgi:isoquinoline 1-oxidoreductase